MFLGKYQHSFDDRNRLTVPSKYREDLAGGAYVIQSIDRCLMVLTISAFETIYKRVMEMNITDPSARLLRRLVLSTAFQLEVDSAGRILIPQELRDYAELKENAVLVGQGDYFELWSPAAWAPQEDMLNDPETNAARFATYDLRTR